MGSSQRLKQVLYLQLITEIWGRWDSCTVQHHELYESQSGITRYSTGIFGPSWLPLFSQEAFFRLSIFLKLNSAVTRSSTRYTCRLFSKSRYLSMGPTSGDSTVFFGNWFRDPSVGRRIGLRGTVSTVMIWTGRFTNISMPRWPYRYGISWNDLDRSICQFPGTALSIPVLHSGFPRKLGILELRFEIKSEILLTVVPKTLSDI